MKAIRIREPGGPEVLELVERDDPVAGAGGVVVRVRCAGINRADLLHEARERLDRGPDLYEPPIYGEIEGGGTQVLYLLPKDFDLLATGLPDLDEQPVPELAETLQHGVYRGFIAPVALYAVLGFVLLRNRKKNGEHTGGEATS